MSGQSARMSSERDWFYPAAVLTLLLGGIATAGDGSPLPLLSIFPLWAIIGIFAFGAIIVGFTLSMMRNCEIHPTRALLSEVRRSTWPAIGFCLAGLNMCSFMRVKPLLNQYVAFTADPLLRTIDRIIFLGHDGAQVFTVLNTDFLGIVYSRAWFGLIVVALLLTLFRTPSPQKTQVMLAYFALWTVVGPLIHVALPAVGPIFYSKAGFGDEFSYLASPPSVSQLRDYLWSSYISRVAGPGTGISAMPSLHLATTAWAIIAIRQIWERTAPLFILGALIFALSIALGWHYLVDGVVGILFACALMHKSARGERIRRFFASRASKKGIAGSAISDT